MGGRPFGEMRTLVWLLLAGTLIGAAACGPAVKPSTGSSSRMASSSRGVAFATCMRAHGIANFPDPTSGPPGGGQPPGRAVMVFDTPKGPIMFDLQSAGIHKSPRLKASVQACQSQLGISGRTGQRVTARQDYLRAAACMCSQDSPTAGREADTAGRPVACR